MWHSQACDSLRDWPTCRYLVFSYELWMSIQHRRLTRPTLLHPLNMKCRKWSEYHVNGQYFTMLVPWADDNGKYHDQSGNQTQIFCILGECIFNYTALAHLCHHPAHTYLSCAAPGCLKQGHVHRNQGHVCFKNWKYCSQSENRTHISCIQTL